MKINRKKLNKSLAAHSAIVDSRNSNSALRGIVLSAKDGSWRVLSNDGLTQLTTSIPSEPGTDVAPIVLNFKALSKICKLQKTPDVDIQCDENKIIVDGVTLEAWVASAEFPDPREAWEATSEDWGPTAEIAGSTLYEALEYVLPAVAEDNTTRLGLNVVRVDGDKLIATDGSRMHICKNVPLGFTASIAKNAATALAGALKKVETTVFVVVNKKAGIGLWCDCAGINYNILTAAVDLPFPLYERVLPRDDEYVFAKIESSAIEKLDRISKLCKVEKKGHTPFCRATFNGNLVLDALDCDRVVFRETVALNFSETLDEPIEFSTGFNPKYLIDALNVANAEIIGFKNAYSPVIVRSGNTQALIMPARL